MAVGALQSALSSVYFMMCFESDSKPYSLKKFDHVMYMAFSVCTVNNVKNVRTSI